jgi:hypothetical protein
MSSVTIDLPEPPQNAPPIEYWIDDYFERLTPILKTALQDTYRQWLEQSIAKPAGKNPFAMPFDEFEKLSHAEQSEIRRQAFSRNRGWINEQLRQYRAEWIVVIGGKVVKSSSTLDDEPAKSEMKKMGQKQGLAPFLFAREPMIEEGAATITAFPWAGIGATDFYPTIGIAVSPVDAGSSNVANNTNWLMADFDTGSPVIIVRSVDVEQSG